MGVLMSLQSCHQSLIPFWNKYNLIEQHRTREGYVWNYSHISHTRKNINFDRKTLQQRTGGG